ncbi:uncharacterized membrane protein YjjB (DUF3815 family) [Paenibacillus turicensis]|jgi:uncharacterized membrane protein YjjB (DUF3815 family)|uniref:Uncharacterized membrane protein YjjB (DUF3815 family) n=1 Tax=Paenibacillus turicensis TaxID=160487 RepID=A0ABS4FLZ9_9BACL|nr:threonine/serine exporter family protein [Paenibacillus turicensis]MBP1903603.1 uncharacterized membrane protein YjjB (DUF3815 family) [Paenibacillus turicensis]
MTFIVQLITSFIASAAFAVLFNAPKKSLLLCGLSGMLSWAAYILLKTEMDAMFSIVASSFIVGIVGQICARYQKKPVIIFSVAGIIPLVPGGLAYDAMRRFVENNYNEAVQLAAGAFLMSGSIAIGLILSEVLNQIITRKNSK